jgi:hypothetical protein
MAVLLKVRPEFHPTAPEGTGKGAFLAWRRARIFLARPANENTPGAGKFVHFIHPSCPVHAGALPQALLYQ